MKGIRVVGLAKTFGKVGAVNHMSFEVQAGWLVTLLGPSGRGKTTALRLIAGRVEDTNVYVPCCQTLPGCGPLFACQCPCCGRLS